MSDLPFVNPVIKIFPGTHFSCRENFSTFHFKLNFMVTVGIVHNLAIHGSGTLRGLISHLYLFTLWRKNVFFFLIWTDLHTPPNENQLCNGSTSPHQVVLEMSSENSTPLLGKNNINLIFEHMCFTDAGRLLHD